MVVALSLGLNVGLALGLICGMIYDHGQAPGLIGGLTKFGMMYGLVFGLSYGLIAGLIVGLTRGLTFGLIFGLVIFGLTYGIIFELRGGLLYWLLVGFLVGLCIPVGIGLACWSKSALQNGVTLVETMSWKWNQFWKRAIYGSIFGLILGLILRLIYGLALPGLELTSATILGIFGLIFGLISGLAGGFTDRIKEGKAFPNQGIELSWENSSAAFLVTCSTSALIFWVIFEPSFGLIYALIVGLNFGLIVGLNRGGAAVIKHYALRLMLWLSGHTPFNFIKFLDQCAKLIFLKKVGGGYIFIHRMLLDYFAGLPQSTKVGDGKTGSVGP